MKSPISSAVLSAIIGIGCPVGLIDGYASAETLRIQGSSQLVSQVLLPYRDRIENAAGYKLNITSSKASLGLLALFDGEADLAMVSAQVQDIVAFFAENDAGPALSFFEGLSCRPDAGCVPGEPGQSST